METRKFWSVLLAGNRTPHKLVFQHKHVGTWYTTDGTASDGEDPASICSVFECATCHDISLYSHLEPVGFEDATLVYPKADSLHKSVPAQVASNYSEAKRIQTISPNAFAMLMRRSLEALCDDRRAPPGIRAKRLQALAEKGEIPPFLRKSPRFCGVWGTLERTTLANG